MRKTVEWAAYNSHHALTLNLIHRYPDTLANALKCAAYGRQPGLIAALLDEEGPTGQYVIHSMVEQALLLARQNNFRNIVELLTTWQENHPTQSWMQWICSFGRSK